MSSRRTLHRWHPPINSCIHACAAYSKKFKSMHYSSVEFSSNDHVTYTLACLQPSEDATCYSLSLFLSFSLSLSLCFIMGSLTLNGQIFITINVKHSEMADKPCNCSTERVFSKLTVQYTSVLRHSSIFSSFEQMSFVYLSAIFTRVICFIVYYQ